MVSYKRSRNLKEILVPTKLPKTDYAPTQNWKHPGSFKDSAKKCDICQNYLKETENFLVLLPRTVTTLSTIFLVTKRTVFISSHAKRVNCNTSVPRSISKPDGVFINLTLNRRKSHPAE